MRITVLLTNLLAFTSAISLQSNASLKQSLSASGAGGGEVYTSNSLCRQNYCINPLFPGLVDLDRLESTVWQCGAVATDLQGYLRFCTGTVPYTFALPSPNLSAVAIDRLIKAQDDAAATMFFYHLNGMGYDPWEHREPRYSEDPCVQAVWRMVCYTYFPQSQAGCSQGQQVPYRRPCQSSCMNYITQCAVECCDESVACTFSHTIDQGDGSTLIQTGYVDADAPSAICTGMALEQSSASARGINMLILLLVGLVTAHAVDTSGGMGGLARYGLVGTVLFVAFTLQGCDVEVPRHTIGAWRSVPDYLVSSGYLPDDDPDATPMLNSCRQDSLKPYEMCQGHGFCRTWNVEHRADDPITFCECERDWAGPECRTRRKSQVTTYLLSLFFGYLGADYFYLGFPLFGMAKLCTLGGLGLWWIFDIVRTGSAPVYAYQYRVAADLPKWAYVLSSMFCFICFGFLVAIWGYLKYRQKKRDDLAMLQQSEESAHYKTTLSELDGPRFWPEGGKDQFLGRPRPGNLWKAM